ncbi:MAG: PAS domain S-box protein [Acidimicrobiia bacterium]|nr:PAS domain S-box protein [Acidimicrobiia bacterium]
MIGGSVPFIDHLIALALLVGLAGLGGLVIVLLDRRAASYYVVYLGVVIMGSLVVDHQDEASTELLLALMVAGASFIGIATAYDQISKRIRGSERRYRELFETAADAIIGIDGDNRIVLFNRQAESVFGYRAEDVIGEPLVMLLPERFRDIHPHHVEGFAQGRVSRRFETSADRVLVGLRRSGEEFPIEITISKRPVDGSLEFTAVVRDITERQRTAGQRELVKECFAAIGSSPNADTALTEVLRRVCEYTGWMVGEAWIPSADGSRLEASPAFYTRSAGLQAFGAAGESISFEPGHSLPGRVWNSGQSEVVPNIADDPEWKRPELDARRGIRAAVAVPALAGGDVAAVLTFLLEAPPPDGSQLVDTISTVAAQLGSTIQKRLAEEALRVSEARNRARLEALPDLVFRLSPEGTFLEYRVPDQSGFFAPTEDRVGKHIKDVLPPELAAELAAASAQARQSGQTQIWNYQFEIGGQLRHREARLVPIHGSDETMVIVRDFTEREQAREVLEASLRSKDQLIASISHELRTPLTAVVGFALVLQDAHSGLSGEERAEMIRTIADEGADLTNIVEDLLTAAKAEAGTLTVVHVPVDLRAQAAQVLETLHQQQTGRIELIGTGIRAIADPARVRQIIRNLISNALKYGGDTIEINVTGDQTTTRIAVTDNGPGIPPGQQERIFEAYQRAHHTPGLTASMGLGLTISRQLAHLMDGNLTYQHQIGQPTFELTLPKAT